MKKPKNADIAVMANDISHIKDEVTEIKKKLDNKFVTKSEADAVKKLISQTDYVTKLEFDPVKKIVYGIISLILTAVFIAIVGLVINK